MTGVLIRKEYHVKRETHRNGHIKTKAKIKDEDKILRTTRGK